MYKLNIRGCSSVWLECLPVTQKVASSSLVSPAIIKTLLRKCFFVSEINCSKTISSQGVVSLIDFCKSSSL